MSSAQLLAAFFLQVFFVLAVCRLVGILARRFGQPFCGHCSEPPARENLRKGKPGTAVFDPRVYVKMDGSPAAGTPSSSMGMDRNERGLAQLAATADRKPSD